MKLTKILNKINEQFVKPRKLSSKEVIYLNNFIKIMREIYNLVFEKENQNIKKYNQFLKFVNENERLYPFLNAVKKQISKLKTEISRVKSSSHKLLDLNSQILDSKQKLESFFKKLNIHTKPNSIIPTVQRVNKIFNIHQKANETDTFEQYSTRIENIFKKSGLASAFFGGGKSSNYIDDFNKRSWEILLNSDIIKPQLTKMPVLKKSSDFTYYIYFIENLSTKKQDDFDTDKIIKFYYEDSEKYKRLLRLVDSFQHSNDKKILRDILTKINEFPELVSYHNKLKNKTKTVYRGVPNFEDMTRDEVLKEEKTRDFVSTSKSESVAERFAMSRGHLESEDRTDGHVIEYSVNKDSILLDFSIFGSLYYESEIIINPKKAKVLRINFIRKQNE